MRGKTLAFPLFFDLLRLQFEVLLEVEGVRGLLLLRRPRLGDFSWCILLRFFGYELCVHLDLLKGLEAGRILVHVNKLPALHGFHSRLMSRSMRHIK